MNNHDPAVYRNLLSRYRDGYAKYSRSIFVLEALTPAEYEEYPPECKCSLIEIVGVVPLSEDSEDGTSEDGTEEHFMVYAAVGGLVNYPDPDCYKKRVESAKAAWDRFKPLAALAGAHLPVNLRSAIPFEPADSASWWLNTMWWFQQPSAKDLDTVANKRRFLSNEPFLDAIRTIEGCRLVTDTPAFPSTVRCTDDSLAKSEIPQQEHPPKIDRWIDEATQGESNDATGDNKKPKRRGRKPKAWTKTCADFAKPLIENKGLTWREILVEYKKEYPDDTEVTVNIIRLAYQRTHGIEKRRKAP